MRAIFLRILRIWPYFSTVRAGFIASGLCTIVVASTEPLVPWLLQQMLDLGFKGSFPLWAVPVALIGTFVLRGGATFGSQYGLAWSAYRGTESMRAVLFKRLMDAHPSLYTGHSSSSLINIVAHEIQQGALQLSTSGLSLIRDLLTLTALLFYLLWMNWQLTLFVTILLPTVAYVMRTLSKRLHRLALEGQKATDQMAYVVEENVLAWRIVRMHGAQAQQTARFDTENGRMRRLSLKSTTAAATMTPLTQTLAAFAMSAVIVTALWQARNGAGTVGGFVGFVTAMLLLIAPIKRLSDVAVPITRGLAALDRALHLMDDTPAETNGSHAVERARGDIRLQGVTLHYPSSERPALEGINLDIPAGQVVALVGPSGAGKSTLINLLPRFIEPSSGHISIDGVALPDWQVEALRRQFALVSQDVVLFNDSIAANVALGGQLDRERVRDALRAANLLDFAEAQPQGIDAQIGHNGQRLSGGQRQRLAIARAIYKDAPILILDEATSALDSESERLVQNALERLMRGRTSIVIAHRLSTIENADRVVVLDGGRLVEQGSHAELLAQGGLFARLHALQFQS